MYSTLITPAQLKDHLDDPSWAVMDCRYSLQDPHYGRKHYQEAHIPSAVYVHLDEDLSGPVKTGVTGRHPLPSPQQAAHTFSNLGIGPGVQVVAYDDAGGALAAVRLWWMLRWLGHSQAAVLDGGWQRWQQEGLPVRSGSEQRPRYEFQIDLHPEKLVDASEVERMRQSPGFLVIDARTEDRYRGQNEVIDPIAGHIPGAVSAPYLENLTPSGTFKSPAELRQHYDALLNGIQPHSTAAYCGSGVTSIHNILAMVHAGMDEPRLYAGSWSEWITDPQRPVATAE